MDDHTSSVLVGFLDDETRFCYLNYFYTKMLLEIDEVEYALKFDTLYEWWWQIEGFDFPDPDDYDGYG